MASHTVADFHISEAVLIQCYRLFYRRERYMTVHNGARTFKVSTAAPNTMCHCDKCKQALRSRLDDINKTQCDVSCIEPVKSVVGCHDG